MIKRSAEFSDFLKEGKGLRSICFLAFTILLIGCGGNSEKLEFSQYPAQKDKGDEWKFIKSSTNKQGLKETFETSTPPTPFFEGYSVIQEKDEESEEAYFVNKSGKVKGDTYKEAQIFHNGLAATVKENEPIKFKTSSFETAFKALNKEGKPFLKSKSFNNGYCPVMNLNNEWGYINKEGEVKIDPKYHNCSHFYNGYAVVVEKDSNEFRWGLIDKQGNNVIDPSSDYQFLGVPKDNRIRFSKDKNEWGYLNYEGKEVIDDKYEKVTTFNSGLGSFKEDDEWGVINKEGKEILDAEYHKPIIYFGEYATIINDDMEYGIINREGKEIIEPEEKHTFIAPPIFGSNFLFGNEDGEFFFTNKKGEKKNKDEFEVISTASKAIHEEYMNSKTFATNPFIDETIATRKVDVSKEVAKILGKASKESLLGFNGEEMACDISYINDNMSKLYEQEKQNQRYWDKIQQSNRQYGTIYKFGGYLKYPYSENPYNIAFDENISVDDPEEVFQNGSKNFKPSNAEFAFSDRAIKPKNLVKKEEGVVDIYVIKGGVECNPEAQLQGLTLTYSFNNNELPDVYLTKLEKGIQKELKDRGFEEVEKVKSGHTNSFSVDLKKYSEELVIDVAFPNTANQS